MHAPSSFAAITFVRGHRQRTVVLNRWLLGVIALVLPFIAACYLCATVYFVWHDQLLASLMTRQSEMQYGYEDRIAALKTALDQETSRGNTDRLTLQTSVHDLALKSERLEARATTIDDLVVRLMPSEGSLLSMPTGPAGSVRAIDKGARGIATPSPSELRLEDHADAGGDPRYGDTTTTVEQARASRVARDFDRLADRQGRIMSALAGPALRSVERMTAALAKTGLSFDHRNGSSDIGGPFVPLPAGNRDFEQSAALLRDATRWQANLSALVGSVPLRKPLAGSLDVTSSFGARLDPFFGRAAMHTGIDLRKPLGETVRATAGGLVTIAGADGGYGNLVEIDHGNGLRTRYAHLGSISVAVDQKVGPGAIVGRVGSTGRATGPHLHYEVRIDGEPVDPTRFLKAGADLFPG